MTNINQRKVHVMMDIKETTNFMLVALYESKYLFQYLLKTYITAPIRDFLAFQLFIN